MTGVSPDGDRAGRPADQAPAGLGDTATIPDAGFTLPAKVRETYPLDPDFGPYTTRLRTQIHQLCDVSEELYGACEDLLRWQRRNGLDEGRPYARRAETALRKARGEL